MICACQVHVEEEPNEVRVVVMADAVVDPGTVVVYGPCCQDQDKQNPEHYSPMRKVQLYTVLHEMHSLDSICRR